jgi:hypothetical protein
MTLHVGSHSSGGHDEGIYRKKEQFDRSDVIWTFHITSFESCVNGVTLKKEYSKTVQMYTASENEYWNPTGGTSGKS